MGCSHVYQNRSILDKILAHKADEVAERKTKIPFHKLQNLARVACVPRHFDRALRAGDYVALIAEVKKASPSKGVLIEHFDPVAIGKTYAAYGASAISVLTDKPFFMGGFSLSESGTRQCARAGIAQRIYHRRISGL